MLHPNPRALEFLMLSNATSISLWLRRGVCSIGVGMPSTDDVIETHWIDAGEAAAVAVEARRLAGSKPGVNTVSQALLQAASDRKVTLTPNHIALARATDAALRIDRHMEAFRLDGTLDEFNGEFKRRQAAARAAGFGFMSLATATARLRRALIPVLTNPHLARSQIFTQVFRDPTPVAK